MVTRQNTDWLDDTPPERRPALPAAARVGLLTLALAVVAGGALLGPRLFRTETTQPREPQAVVVVRPLPSAPTVVAAPVQETPMTPPAPPAIVGEAPRPAARPTQSQPAPVPRPAARPTTAPPAARVQEAPASTPRGEAPAAAEDRDAQAERRAESAGARGFEPAPAPAAGFRRELRLAQSGSRMNGEDVRQVQIRLMTLAGEDPRLGGDGWFGPRTERGVRQFQERAGLPVTGVVDQATWNALFGTNAAR